MSIVDDVDYIKQPLFYIVIEQGQGGCSKHGGLRHVLQEGEAGDRWPVPSLRRVRGQKPCVVHRPPYRHPRRSGHRDGGHG